MSVEDPVHILLARVDERTRLMAESINRIELRVDGNEKKNFQLSGKVAGLAAAVALMVQLGFNAIRN